MAVFSAQEGRPPSGGEVEMALRRGVRIPPCVVVPAGPLDPGACRQPRRPVFDPLQDVFEAARASEVDVKVSVGKALEVYVRIDEARKRAAAQPDDLGAPPGGRPRARADG